MPSRLFKNQPATDFAEATTDFYVRPGDSGCCFPPSFRASNPLVAALNFVARNWFLQNWAIRRRGRRVSGDSE
jgi:hypothetical protein